MSFLRASFSPKSYFPPVWFAEADDSHLTDDERRPEGVAPDPSDRRDDEQHYAKHREYARRVYRQDDATRAEPLPPTIPPSVPPGVPLNDPISNRSFDHEAPNLAAFKADLDAAAQTVAIAKQITADAIAKAQQQTRDDEEEALLLLLL